MPPYRPNPARYAEMTYRRCGNSGVLLPAVSLGLWHNFGAVDRFATARATVLRAFVLGITHFDLANNYGPPPGSAETNLGKILRRDLVRHRDELIISTKAGWDMWLGPYGDWGSRKYLLASLDQSLARMGLECVDIFYHHRPAPDTPLEETMGALHHAVHSGKALYAGISAYPQDLTRRAATILASLGTRLLIHQPKYSMLVREPERGLLGTLQELGIGCIGFSPLAQGLLTDRYFKGIPKGSRASKPHGFLKREQVTDAVRGRVLRLNEIARARGQSLAQMAVAWTLRHPSMTSTVIGASRPAHVVDAVNALKGLTFSGEELAAIDGLTP
ncbi:MAG: aldo/keto reductase [Gemmatimonadales bacterium]